MATCRICYEEGTVAMPLVSPCDCKGSVEFQHKHCLTQWIETSLMENCELCKVKYDSVAFSLEVIPAYHPLLTRLSTRAPLVLALEAMLYIMCCESFGEATIRKGPDAFFQMMSDVTPLLLFGLVALQLVLLVPAIRVLKDRARYFRTAWSCRFAVFSVSPFWCLVILAAGLVVSFYNAVAGALMVVSVCLHTWNVHQVIVRYVNRDIIRGAVDTRF